MSAPTVNPATPPEQDRRSGLAKWIRRLAIPIIIGWVLVVALLNIAVPQLEVVGQMRSVSMSPIEAPSVIAMKRVGEDFEEFKSDSSAMIVLEGDQPLGADAHQYYDELVDKLRSRHEARRARPGLLGRPADRGRRAEQRRQGRVRAGIPRGQHGRGAGQRVGACRSRPSSTSFPPRRASRCTSPADRRWSPISRSPSDRSIKIIEIVTLRRDHHNAVARLPLDRTVLLVLVMVFLDAAATRGVVAFLGYHELIGLSTFATNLLVTLAIAAATDYAIFLIGRYQEARTIRRGPGIRLLHDVSRHRARGAGLGHDDRGRDVLPSVHPAAVVPDLGVPMRGRHGRRRDRRADAGPGDHHRR